MRRALALALALAVSGCSTLSYLWQAARGQLEVARLARPMDEVAADPATAPEVRDKLAYAARARGFASRELGLPDNASFRRYADIGRPYVVWNVFAAPELSLELVTQCFPIAGCVPYRGFFARADAEAHAATLRARRLDVHVGGVPAYSTLGWFADPLLSTVIRYPRTEIARLVFHELAHQVAYARDDATFNESFATAVEEEGMRRWLAVEADAAERAASAAFAGRRRAVMRLFHAARRTLEAAYAGPAGEDARRAAKAAAFARLESDYRALRAGWSLPEAQQKAWDEWVFSDLNNARLGSIATYTARVPQFAALLAREGGDMRRFLTAARALADLPRAERERQLDALAPEATED